MLKTLFRIKISLIFILLGLTSITSCATQSQLTPSNYQTQLKYPQQTNELYFLEQEDSDNPLYGTQLTYQSKFYELDLFNVFIYPIREINWQQTTPILMSEARLSYQALDDFVKNSNYQSRTLEDIEQLEWQLGNKKQQGLRGVSQIHLHDDLYMHNYCYFFIEEDKIIRISVNMKLADQLPPPDDYVQGLLEKLEVPKESTYMAQLRKSVTPEH